jgi:glycosyltransferase involved in cell wall biosynthesis
VTKERPTILQIIPQLDAGGAELSTVEMAEAIVLGGGRAIVLAEPGRLSARLQAVGAEAVAFPAATKNPFKMLTNARAIARTVKNCDVDLVHARSRAPAWSALIAARQTGVAFVTTYHGAYGETNTLKSLYNSVMARGDAVIANSNYTAELIAARYATARSRIVVVHRGVDTAAFDPEKIAADRVTRLRQAWGVAPDRRIVLQAARLTRWKGQTVLIDAVARAKQQGDWHQAVAVLAGDAQGRGSYAQELQDQIERLGLQKDVRLVGHVDDMAAAYLAAHVTVVASTEPEAFGRATAEAAALGCPVIATSIGAPGEIVLAQPVAAKAQMTGWLVPPGDAGEMAHGLKQALGLSPAERSEMGARARRRVLADFTTQSMQRSTLTIYDRLLGTALAAQFSAGNTHNHSLTQGAPKP